MNRILIKRYIQLVVVILLTMGLFVYLEKNQLIFQFKSDKVIDQRSYEIMDGLTGNDAVKFQVFIDKNTVIAEKIIEFFKPFKLKNKEISLEFIDPLTNPEAVKNNGVSMQGEMVLTYLDKSRTERVNVTELSESAIINAVIRLQNNRDEWLIFAEGYGMKSISDESAAGLSQFLIHLKKLGIKVARMPLNPLVELPENVKVIVMPAPTESLDENMVTWLKKYTSSGVSLLWLNDTYVSDQTLLELAYDVISGDKVLIKGDKYTDVLVDFPTHFITEKFNQPVYIPEARAVSMADAKAVMQTDNNEIIASAQDHKNHRLLIMGDADFITNQYINLAANKNFAERVIDWLFFQNKRLNVAVQINNHTQLYLSKKQLLFLSLLFLIVIPLFMLYQVWRQKKLMKTYD